MENRFHITVLACHLDTLVHIGFYLRIGFKITVYQLFGFFAVDIHAFRQAKYGDTVDNTEIGSLGLTAHIGGNLFYIYLINLGSCSRMNIIATEESIDHVFIFTQVCHYA